MRIILSIVSCIICLSCDNKQSSSQRSQKKAFDSTISNELHDSISKYDIPFTTDHFPDSVKEILYKTNDTLWDYVYTSLLPDVKTMPFPNQSFFSTLVENDFEIDSTNRYFFSQRKQFNKRQSIQFDLRKPDTVEVYNFIWYGGKKYFLMTTKYNNAYREKENYR